MFLPTAVLASPPITDEPGRAPIAVLLFLGLALAGLIAYLLVRSAPPRLARLSLEGKSPYPSTRDSRDIEYIHWLIRLRWLAIATTFLLVATAQGILPLLPRPILPTGVEYPMFAVLLFLAVANLFFTHWSKIPKPWLLHAQIWPDLVALTTLLHFSGGVENPMSILAILHVIIAGIILERRHCFGVAIGSGTMYASMVLCEWIGLVPHYRVVLFHSGKTSAKHVLHEGNFALFKVAIQTGILLIVAYLVSAIVERLRSKEAWIVRMMDQVVESEQLLEQALATTGTGLCVLQPEASGITVRWRNAELSRILPQAANVGRADPCPRPITKVAHQTLQDGKRRHVGLSDTAYPGQRLAVTAAPIGEGSHRAVAILVQDVTRTKQAEEQLVRAGRFAALGELAGNVAHEVNNPTAIISAKARLLLSDGDLEIPKRVEDDLAKIADLADRIAATVQSLLSYCRRKPAERLPLDLSSSIGSVVAMIEHKAMQQGVRIALREEAGIPNILGSRQEVEQVLLNLTLNAIDAMPQGGDLTIATGLAGAVHAERAPAVETTFEDTGTGIPEKIQDRVFDPFFTTKPAGHGTGLGLSISQAIIESYGGSLTIQSDGATGTTVRILWPLEAGKGHG